ncbi:AAA family ATPase [Chryseolinea sp. H1M3-3]|uniref:AAA family ATPase n=1 Tax=Chryseolinea sp. H1M3-3 TaxID=3034144 RepID=UPI0023EB2C0E|nr:AAA family ATPase [Chryseolinea sp. H1M3-3]
MKIDYLQISNVLSFRHYDDVSLAPKITIDSGLNILIGQNGAGKSTALEVINFIFKKVLFVPYNINTELYTQKDDIVSNEKKQIIHAYNHNDSFQGFRLEPNWNTENQPQKIILQITLDDIDENNLTILEQNKGKLDAASGLYSGLGTLDFRYSTKTFTIEITLNDSNKTFSFTTGNQSDPGFQYLVRYDFYKRLIEIYNQDHTNDQLPNLHESFTLISSYRNYHSFTPLVSLSKEAANQIQEIRRNEFRKSANSNEQAEPPIFNLVRLRIAERHYDLIFTNVNNQEATRIANQEPFLLLINQKLSLINLKVEISLIKKSNWSYTFHLIDTKRNKILRDINSLSAGQKAIIHLIFEAYGRGQLKGGVVIIDEPEIHLHYQFQHEYLDIIEKLNSEQNCQYIIVTHSEALISSKTIDRVKRFALDDDNYTIIRSPTLRSDQKTLIKILDNTRSTYAFFAKKVILVEGDTDRYFFRAVFQELAPNLSQEVAILDIGGKGNFKKWKLFFEGFGLKVYFVADFDNVFNLEVLGQTIIPKNEKDAVEGVLKQAKLDSLAEPQLQRLEFLHRTLASDTEFLKKPKRSLWKPLLDYYIKLCELQKREVVNEVRLRRSDVDVKIDSLYANNIFVLKMGAIEEYTKTSSKDLNAMISFCDSLASWLSVKSIYTDEIKHIVGEIVK